MRTNPRDRGLLTIIVPFKNHFEDVQACLHSIWVSLCDSGTDERVRVILVDDHSDQATCDLFENTGFGPQNVINNCGVGPGAARNTGFESSISPLVAFVDSDCVVAKDWIQRILEHASQSDASVFQGVPWLFRKDENPRLGQLEESLYGHMFATYVKGAMSLQIDTRNLVLRRGIALPGVRLFTEVMAQAQAESRVLGQLLIRHGHCIHWTPDLQVFHKDPRSLPISFRQKYRHGSGRVYVWSHPPELPAVIARYFLEPISAGIDPTYVVPVHLAFMAGYYDALHSTRDAADLDLQRIVSSLPIEYRSEDYLANVLTEVRV